MKIAALAMVRNECDIIELFLKINLRTFDFIYVLDHLSDDSTPLIIQRLIERGFPIGYARLDAAEYNQREQTTATIRQIAATEQYDYLMPIDADEFLYSDQGASGVKETLRSYVRPDRCAHIPWSTYCPLSADYGSFDRPLYENFRPRRAEYQPWHKVVLGNEFAKSCHIQFGNHSATGPHSSAKPPTLPLILQHVPVRSAEQIMRKALIGSYALRLRSDFRADLGGHWHLLADTIRRNGYRVGAKELLDTAYQYGDPFPAEPYSVNSLNLDGPRIGLDTDFLEYPSLATVSLLESLDALLQQLLPRG